VPCAIHRRELSVRGSEVYIRDVVEASGRHRLRWCFHLHPSVRAQPTPQGFILTIPETGGLRLTTNAVAPDLRIAKSEYSPGYASREPALACTAEGEYLLSDAVEWKIRAMD
jgi:hypothetical protein